MSGVLLTKTEIQAPSGYMTLGIKLLKLYFPPL